MYVKGNIEVRSRNY